MFHTQRRCSQRFAYNKWGLNPMAMKAANGGLHETVGWGATKMVTNLKPCIFSWRNWNTTDGGACSVWSPGSIFLGHSKSTVKDSECVVGIVWDYVDEKLRLCTKLTLKYFYNLNEISSFWIIDSGHNCHDLETL